MIYLTSFIIQNFVSHSLNGGPNHSPEGPKYHIVKDVKALALIQGDPSVTDSSNGCGSNNRNSKMAQALVSENMDRNPRFAPLLNFEPHPNP